MPRISRTDVEFSVRGRLWLARFFHTHNEQGIMRLSVADHAAHRMSSSGDGRMICIKHLTSCRLSYKDHPGVFLWGDAPCSMKDTYDWKKGLKLSLLRALEKGGFCQLRKGCGEVVGRDAKLQPIKCDRTAAEHALGPHKHAYVAELHIDALKPEFGEAMTSFFRELAIKDYWPHRPGDQPKQAPSAVDEVISTVAVSAQRLLSSPPGPGWAEGASATSANMGVAVARPVGAVPATCLHGLGWTGMD